MKKAAAIVAMTLLGFALCAVPMTVTWADGKVELLQGGKWLGLNIGDKVDSSSTIKLGQSSSAELSGGGMRISISAPGQFNLAELLKSRAASNQSRTDVLSKLGKLVDPKLSTGDSTIGGVRGAAVEPTADVTKWESEDADIEALMEEGRSLSREGKFIEAAAKFHEAVLASTDLDKEGAMYAEAWAYSSDGSLARAVKVLRLMAATGSWAGPRALLLARLDIDSGAKAEAAAVLEAGIATGIFAGDDLGLAKSLLAEAKS